jgi:hypothetical protein
MNPNPPSKSIDIGTQEGLDLLKRKAIYYGHYAEQLKVMDLILEIERLRQHDCDKEREEIEALAHETAKKLGW